MKSTWNIYFPFFFIKNFHKIGFVRSVYEHFYNRRQRHDCNACTIERLSDLAPVLCWNGIKMRTNIPSWLLSVKGKCDANEKSALVVLVLSINLGQCFCLRFKSFSLCFQMCFFFCVCSLYKLHIFWCSWSFASTFSPHRVIRFGLVSELSRWCKTNGE